MDLFSIEVHTPNDPNFSLILSLERMKALKNRQKLKLYTDNIHISSHKNLMNDMRLVLDNVELEVLFRYMGVSGFKPHTLEEISKEMGYTIENIKQIFIEAMSKLSQKMHLMIEPYFDDHA